MTTRDGFKPAWTGETENNRIYPGFSPKARKRWSGTIGRLLQTVIETEKPAKHESGRI
ncbi:MAG: hypothetical protein VB084_08655 [Syntrophomonadaceae bacterium]|nr:hypothetical protein [Syntrophomonadaceae bacterium]